MRYKTRCNKDWFEMVTGCDISYVPNVYGDYYWTMKAKLPRCWRGRSKYKNHR